MRKILLFGIALFCVVSVFSQEDSAPFSCHQTKSHFHKKAASTDGDLRSDTLDIKHTIVHLDMTNWSGRAFTAKAEITYEVKTAFTNSIQLDLLGLIVDSVKMNGTHLIYNHNDTVIAIVTPTFLAGQEITVEVYYHGQPVQNSGDWGGFYWNNTYAYNVGVSFVEDPHNYGRVWFPCFDNFVERNTFEYFITTNSARKAFCNGLLQNEIDNGNGTTTWHWEIAQEIPSYLASVAVADYETVEMDYNGIPIQLAVRAADSTNLKNSFVHLPEAIQAFEVGYGDYVFDRVGYCVTNFGSGAMEHATNITYMRAAVNGNTQWETLMAHELAHHWWGDNITCRTDEDMWLNEGWATYSEALFTEFVYGADAYKDYIRENHESVLRTLHVDDGGYYPVAGVPHDLVYSSTVYDKGGDMAHTLRGILGDADFFSCIDGFMTDYRFSDVSTDDMMTYFSDCSGKDLSSFFDTWIKEKGFHHYSISTVETMDNGDGTYSVEGTIKQKLRENTSYTTFMPIQVTAIGENFDEETVEAIIYGECSSFSMDLPFEPVFMALDLDEKISDATVDNYQMISSIGNYDFDMTRAELEVIAIFDSSLVRIEHHFIKPDVMQSPINGLHISPDRYWTVDGVFSNGFRANVTFDFNGTTNSTSGYLDRNFITTTEDSLVMMYRPDASTDWAIVDSFMLNTLGSVTNTVGNIEVFDVKRGDYVLAIYDANKVQDSTAVTDACVYTAIDDIERMQNLIRIYPIPAADDFVVELLDENIKARQLKVYNILGKEVYRQNLKPRENKFKIDVKNWSKGTYIVSLQNGTEQIFSQKIIVE